MKFKVFDITEQDKANKFIQSVKLIDTGAIQVTSEGVVIFYKDNENYEKQYLTRMLETLKEELVHQETLLISRKLEAKLAHKTANKETFKNKEEAVKTVQENIELIQMKIDAYEQKLSNN